MTTTERPADRFDSRLMPPLLIGAVLNPINSSIIAVALVPIGTALGATAASTAWLVSGLYLATAIGQPLTGRLIDLFGPRRLFLAGACLVSLAGVIGLVATDIPMLVLARIILGFGTCAGYPAAMYLIRAESVRTGIASPAGVLTALSIATQTINVLGPTLGGVLIHLGGWRSTFAINVPLGLLSLALGYFILPKHTVIDLQPEQRQRIDWRGAGLFSAALTALLLFLMSLHVTSLWLLAVALILGAAFAWWELRRDDPFIDVRVFVGNVPLLLTYLRSVLTATVAYCYLYGFTQWLEDGRALSPGLAGIMLVPTFVLGIVVAFVAGRRGEVIWKLRLGSAAQVFVAVLLLTVDSTTPLWLLGATTLLMGLPQGMVTLANQNALYHQSDPERTGASAGLLRTFMYLGAMLAAAATKLVFPTGADDRGMHDLGWFMLTAAAGLFVLSVADRSLGRVGR